MKREEVKQQIDDLMQQYSNEEIDGETYFKNMMEVVTNGRDNKDED